MVHYPGNRKETNKQNWPNSYNDWDIKDFENKNVGLVTGRRSGLVVIDIDQRSENGVSIDEKLEQILDVYPTGLISKTGGGDIIYFILTRMNK